MNARTHLESAADLLGEACQWRLLSLLLSRPSAERGELVQRLASETTAPRLAALARAWIDNATEGAYLQLLGPGGLVAAREVAYRPFADPGWLLADISRYHQAFAFSCAAEEPPDHIAVLAEFVSYLLLKEAFARECASDEAAEMTREARNRFIEEHITPIAARVAERLDACGATDWSEAARLLAAKAPPPPSGELPVADDEAPQCAGCVPSR
jgi:hypothetical protein